MTSADQTRVTNAPSHKSSLSLKEKAKEEFKMFWAIAIYLALMFSAFLTYRRLTLLESGITYLHYGAGIIEALILAKVILIGRALKLGKRFEDEALIQTVLFKSIAYGVFVALFAILEHVIEGLVHHETWGTIASHLLSAGRQEILAKTIVIMTTLIPFLAFLETDRACW